MVSSGYHDETVTKEDDSRGPCDHAATGATAQREAVPTSESMVNTL